MLERDFRPAAGTEQSAGVQVLHESERHGDNQISVAVFRTSRGDYTFSVQCRILRIIRVSYPWQHGGTYATPAAAKTAALKKVGAWGSSRAAQAVLSQFSMMPSSGQLEFDFSKTS